MSSRILGVALLVSLTVGSYVYLSSDALPPVVASHFAAGGAANGTMPRAGYVALMMLLSVGLPLLFALLSAVVDRVPPRRLSLPNRDFWLAAERRDQTLSFLRWHGAFPGVLVAVFLCFVHWLVLRANAVQPPRFPESALLAALPVFLVALAAWIAVLFLRFRRTA